MKIRLTLQPVTRTRAEHSFDFEDFKRWTAEKKKQWVTEHPDSKFAKLLGIKPPKSATPEKPSSSTPERKDGREQLHKRLSDTMERKVQDRQKKRELALRSLDRLNGDAKKLRSKLKDFAWGGNSKKVTPKIARFVESRAKKVADRIETRNQVLHAQMLKVMARTLRKHGIEPKDLKPGSMRASTISYVGRDPKVAKIWDAAKARLKETQDYKAWAQANQNLKSLRKTQERYSKLAAR
jgi:hypothetical protein